MKTTFTRKLVNIVIGLHRSAILRECQALDAKSDKAYAATKDQEKVIEAERNRLEDLRLSAAQHEDAANAAWRAAAEELATLPYRH
jgi:flagellar biosynthesis regulator FlbT